MFDLLKGAVNAAGDWTQQTGRWIAKNAKHIKKEVFGSAVGAAAGSAFGAATYSAIGGVGVAALGTAVGVTLGPFMAIGAGVGLAAYGIYRFGEEAGR